MSFNGSTYKLRSKLPPNKSSTLANLLRTADFASDLTVEIQDYMRGFSLTRVGVRSPCQLSTTMALKEASTYSTLERFTPTAAT